MFAPRSCSKGPICTPSLYSARSRRCSPNLGQASLLTDSFRKKWEKKSREGKEKRLAEIEPPRHRPRKFFQSKLDTTVYGHRFFLSVLCTRPSPILSERGTFVVTQSSCDFFERQTQLAITALCISERRIASFGDQSGSSS